MKIFGTDGIRGTANQGFITPEFLTKLAAILGYKIRSTKNSSMRVVIGKDTRISSYMIENAITAGFLSSGIKVLLTGPIPTPALSFVTKSLRADMGIMITASHNPYYDNGIKIFDSEGYKISDDFQNEIENLLSKDVSEFLIKTDKLGNAKRLDDAIGRYVEFVKSTFPKDMDLKNIKIALDTANGAGYKIAPEILWELGADVYTISNKPDGFNINLNCGSTHIEAISKFTVQCGADVGIAIDGDADRIVIVDEQGNEVDGNHILAVMAAYMRKNGTLSSNKVISTIICNLGLEDYLESIGLNLIKTDVGDRKVIEEMVANKTNLGGEPSGHIIMSDYIKGSDALIAALQILSMLKKSNKKASEVLRPFVKTTQVSKSIPFNGIFDKKSFENEIKQIKSTIKAKSNIVVRKSGTENVLRITVDGNLTKSEVDNILNLILQKLNEYTKI